MKNVVYISEMQLRLLCTVSFTSNILIREFVIDEYLAILEHRAWDSDAQRFANEQRKKQMQVLPSQIIANSDFEYIKNFHQCSISQVYHISVIYSQIKLVNIFILLISLSLFIYAMSNRALCSLVYDIYELQSCTNVIQNFVHFRTLSACYMSIYRVRQDQN